MGILQVSCQGAGGAGSAPFYNVFHVECATEDEQAVAFAVGAPLRTFYQAWMAYAPITLTYTVPFRVITVGEAPEREYPNDGAAVVGTGVDPAMAPQVALVVSWKTGNLGARYRGRTYLGPLAQDINEGDGVASIAAAAAIQAAADDLVDAIAGIAHTGVTPPALVVYSRKYAAATSVSSVVVNRRLDTQRRRN